jgi:hypothetical protein
MTKITGYVRQREPKWLYISMIILAVVIISAALFAFSAVYSWLENESMKKLQAETMRTTSTTIAASMETTTTRLIAVNAAVAVEKIIFSSGTNEKNQATDDLAEIPLKESGMVYGHTRVNCSAVPAVIRHVWINPSGYVAADIKLTISRRPADTWSYISLLGTKPGKWEFQVRTVNDEVAAKRGFLTY